MLGAFAAVPMSVSAADVKADGDIVYDLIPKGKDYKAATGTGNNQYTAEPGETITIQWTVKNDQKVSGLQMYLDFSALTENGGAYVGAEQGDDIERHQQNFRAGVEAVRDGIAGEILPKRNVF